MTNPDVPTKARLRRRTGSLHQPLLTFGLRSAIEGERAGIRFLNIVDGYQPVCVSIKAGRRITSADELNTLAGFFAMYSVLKRIRRDNGTGLIALAINAWLGKVESGVLSIEPSRAGYWTCPDKFLKIVPRHKNPNVCNFTAIVATPPNRKISQATFYVLDRNIDLALASSETSIGGKMITNKRIQILLVEDDALDAEFVQRAIKNASIINSVTHVSTLAAAIAICQNKTFDLILSDLSLPDCMGSETISKLRGSITKTPIVVLTAVDDVELATILLDSGAQDYLPKNGISGDVLGRAIRHAIQRHEHVSESQELLREISASRELLSAKNYKLELLYRQAHDFVDNVSHEFRTPLSVIKEYSSLISEGFVGEVNSEQIRMLAIIENRVEDLNTMVDDMLDSSKLESGLIGAWRKACSVSDILEYVEETLNRKSQIKGVTLSWQIAEDLPVLFCDAEKIGRVIANLGINALKFCGRPGNVQVSIYQVADSSDVTFEIQDNGPGIEPQCLQQIFERFHQLGTATHSSCKGFGLGLAIAKDLVQLNFGQLSVESVLGHGSKFYFTVPINNAAYITTRFVHQIKNTPTFPQMITLIRASLRDVTNQHGLKESEEFSNSLCRSCDLIFQCQDNSFLYVLTTDKIEVQAFIDRAHATLEGINRNRPRGWLPDFQYENLGTYQVATEVDLAIKVIKGIVTDRHATHV